MPLPRCQHNNLFMFQHSAVVLLCFSESVTCCGLRDGNGMVGDIGLKHMEFIPEIVPVLITVLKDGTPAVPRKAIACGVELFRSTLIKVAIQVSRLLAAIFVPSAATEIFSPYVSPCKALSESHWASNFHQASLDTNLNLKLLTSLSGMQKVQDPIDVERKAGTAPTIEELAVTLRSHDLFIYFGHGRGLQFIPAQGIQKLQNCAATLLMGCSSGSLSLNGSYTPQVTGKFQLHEDNWNQGKR
ncbi:hypothetical protein Vadar_020340 [Vaccinium darrowii]|uniref:Uncharacterized protein n=1 Tax=Vaccinium darrowii TaxID=229202 RepID=A0ACB7X265_9ERIC|nr:hypothetical protein Vadar_020340 [Vaccinium darrowii]